ncbi:hypothetical protein DPMN_020361 [Dreissena polymorpha]|uniref:Uncharacterized protein n=1 Tax=Dreissena polymorpha TaxID=45954 RepID=A0A9D4SA48_DREPO|nr:hypothetical protein DPMN_020361 [Dreissena polymorpha]
MIPWPIKTPTNEDQCLSAWGFSRKTVDCPLKIHLCLRPCDSWPLLFFSSFPPDQLVVKLEAVLGEKSELVGLCCLWTGETDRYGYGVHRVVVSGKRIKLKCALQMVNARVTGASGNAVCGLR